MAANRRALSCTAVEDDGSVKDTVAFSLCCLLKSLSVASPAGYDRPKERQKQLARKKVFVSFLLQPVRCSQLACNCLPGTVLAYMHLSPQPS
jgi:hypothetical protein